MLRYTLSGDVRRDDDQHKVERHLRVPRVDDQTDTSKRANLEA